jgi:hypothetical protein
MFELLNIAWHLNVDFGHNMLAYEVLNYGYTKPSYCAFEIYNNIKQQCFDIDELDENSIYDIFSDEDVKHVEQLIDNLNRKQFILDLHHLYFNDFPTKIGFDLKFLDMNYDNLKEFGEWFMKKNINKENFSSIAADIASKITNEFLKNHIS